MNIAKNFHQLITNITTATESAIFVYPILAVFLFVFLGYACYTDLKERKIKNIWNFFFLGMRIVAIPIIGISWSNIIGGILGFGLMLMIACIVYKNMGGDIKCAGVLGLWIGGWGMGFILFVASFLGIFFGLIIQVIFKKMKDFPFAPFFAAGYIALVLLCVLT